MFKVLTKTLGDYYKSLFFPDKGFIMREVDLDKIYQNYSSPEILDISIIKTCNFSCPYCYQSSTPNKKSMLTLNDISWLIDFFGNHKPYQVALGGGEPTLHPQFTEILELFHSSNIIPNYTTNGTGFLNKSKSDKIIDSTERHCGGVALTYHPHREKTFWKALNILKDLKIQRNVHYIVSHRNIKQLPEFIDKVMDKVDSIVLLEFQPLGRGHNYIDLDVLTDNDYGFLKELFKKYPTGKLAVGASLIPIAILASLESGMTKNQIAQIYYNPEGIFSGYIDENLYLAPSSYWQGEKVYLKNYSSFI